MISHPPKPEGLRMKNSEGRRARRVDVTEPTSTAEFDGGIDAGRVGRSWERRWWANGLGEGHGRFLS